MPVPCPGGTLVAIPYMKCVVVRGRFYGYSPEGTSNTANSCDVQGLMPMTCATLTNIGQFKSFPWTAGEHCSTVERCENNGYISLRAQDGYSFTTTEHDVVSDACPVTCEP